MKRLKNLDESCRITIPADYLEQTVSAHKVELLREVDEGNVYWLSLFSACLLLLSDGKDNVSRRTLRHETIVEFRIYPLSDFL